MFIYPSAIVERARLSRQDYYLFGLRGITHSLGVAFWFFAMTQIPIAEVTAIGYLAPIIVTIGAALFLGERLAARLAGGCPDV